MLKRKRFAERKFAENVYYAFNDVDNTRNDLKRAPLF